jgi:hypothetical protein
MTLCRPLNLAGRRRFSIHCTVPSILFFVFNHTVFTLSRVWQCHFTRTTSDDPLAGEIAMSKELKDWRLIESKKEPKRRRLGDSERALWKKWRIGKKRKPYLGVIGNYPMTVAARKYITVWLHFFKDNGSNICTCWHLPITHLTAFRSFYYSYFYLR